MSIEIKTPGGRVLYVAETAADVKAALVEAVDAGADLRWADLRGADLRGADLREADLRWADLRGADLRGADLREANDSASPLYPIRQDMWAILDAAPLEVPGLRQALVDGKVDGAQYEGPCACLVGTIAKVRNEDYRALDGLKADSSRPSEQWFMSIRPGDVPSDAEERSEGVFRAALAVRWIDEWTESRQRLVKALAGAA